MIIFSEPAETQSAAEHSVSLTYHQRVKGRLRITTAKGMDAGIVATRGKVLMHGQKLVDPNGLVLEILAAPEPVSVASADSGILFARACYHVGNRHAEVQIGNNQLIYLKDHVMDRMLEQLGLKVDDQLLPFSPESGAYAEGHGHHNHVHHSHDSHHHDH